MKNFIVCFELIVFVVCGLQRGFADDFDATTETVGSGADGLVTPVNQLVTPAGMQVKLPGIRPNALALSPDGKLLVTAGLTRVLIVVNPATGTISQRIPFPADKAQPMPALSDGIIGTNQRAKMSFTGLTFSPDGSRIYMANVNGDIKVFGVGKDKTVAPLFSIALPAVAGLKRTNEIPAGIAISHDGKKIYVAGNLSNRLIELDAATGNVLRTWNVGVAPYDVVLCRNKAYVSNWGGPPTRRGQHHRPGGTRDAGARG